MKKKFFSYILTASMVFSQCGVFAEGNTGEETTTEERLPKLHMTYDVVSVLDKINTTGEKAVGQPYYFYNDTSRNSKFNMLNYINKYYTNGTADTNFHEIFQSDSDMRGIQQLVDDCLENKSYRQYEYNDQ